MKLKIFIIILGLLVLLLASEGIYQLRNNKDLQVRTYLNLARFLAQNSQAIPALSFLDKAAEIKMTQAAQDYPQIFTKTVVDKPSLTENRKLLDDYRLLLRELDVHSLSQFNPGKWGNVFYTLGLLAYRNNEPGLVIPFWQIAINLAPEWSYFHVELANYYMSLGRDRDAMDALEFCLKFNYAKVHCQEFIYNNLQSGIPEEVGFLKETIEEI